MVAAIEIVSPANKDRPDTRSQFISKVDTLLRQNVCVSVVDIVTTYHANLYAELLASFGQSDARLGEPIPAIYAVTIREPVLDLWYFPLIIGQELPTIPIWLSAEFGVELNLESSYQEVCRLLRIA